MTSRNSTPLWPFAGYVWACITIGVVAALSAYLLYPALFLDRSLVHADNLHHGYALLKFQHDVVHKGISPLWTNLVYGGHALFAEGQAGLSNPVNYLVVWLFRPEFGHNLMHWLGMTGFGVGCYGLSRTLLISPAASFFATLAATFSSLVIHSNTNMMVIEAMAWVPLTLWAFEAWLRRPTIGQAILFGLTTSMQIFSGYPHFLHGTIIYMAVSAITLFSAGTSRKNLLAIIHKYWPSGTLAIVLCVGISAIQWLPLLELASLSHRQDGVEASAVGTLDFFIRGILYSTDNVSRPANDVIAFFPNTGSLFVCVLASLSLLWPSNARIKGHLIATFVLLNLGLGPASPVYDFIATNHLIPGMSSFRIMFPYFIMSIVGTAILAARSLDRLSTVAEPGQAPNSRWQWLRWPIFIGFWGFTLYHFHTEAAPNINYMILALGVVGLGGLVAARKSSVIPILASLLLVMEIVLVRVSPFGTIENSLLTSTPPQVQHIRATAEHQQFKHFQRGLTALAFSSPYAEELHNRTKQELENIVASNNLLWDVPSFSAALALKHAYKTKVNDVVVSEFTGGSDDKPGFRLMDILSIKWISTGSSVSSHLVAIRDPGARSLLWENPYAKPLVQTYTLVSHVDDPNQALDSLKGDVSGTLYIQATEKIRSGVDPLAVDSGIGLKTNRQSATDYEFQADSESGFWLFMSDTFHPGWKASVDGESTRVFPAQVIGKAVYVPPGQHEVRLYFQSDSFRLGALICILTMLIVLIYTTYAWRKQRITASGNGFVRSNE